MHLSMRGCVYMYSQSSRIPTDCITNSHITLVFFCFPTFVRGSKQWNSKDRLSVMFTVNMMGSDKRPPLIIGKAARPSALKKKNVLLKNLKIEYYNNTRAWMNGPIFHSYMKNWNDELARQRRHILLLIDNAPSHIVDEYLNINIQFLPPNTTSKIQPLDQGIIRSVKCAYRKTIQVQYCSCVENYEEVKQIMQSFDFVVAVNTLVDAWEGVKP